MLLTVHSQIFEQLLFPLSNLGLCCSALHVLVGKAYNLMLVVCLDFAPVGEISTF